MVAVDLSPLFLKEGSVSHVVVAVAVLVRVLDFWCIRGEHSHPGDARVGMCCLRYF